MGYKIDFFQILVNIIIKMCVYEDCIYLCPSKKAHHFRYARMRKNKDSIKIVKSPKVNCRRYVQFESASIG